MPIACSALPWQSWRRRESVCVLSSFGLELEDDLEGVRVEPVRRNDVDTALSF